MIEADFACQTSGSVAEFAGADQGTDTSLGDNADPVVVPVEDIGSSVGPEGQIKGQLEGGFVQCCDCGSFSCYAGTGVGRDPSVGSGVDVGRGRIAREQSKNTEKVCEVGHGVARVIRRMRWL